MTHTNKHVSIKGFAESLSQHEAEELLKSIMGPPVRQLEGRELSRVRRLLDTKVPVESTNNQHIQCDVYKVGHKTYFWHSGTGIDDFIEELLPEDPKAK
jgi:hypothetical protein